MLSVLLLIAEVWVAVLSVFVLMPVVFVENVDGIDCDWVASVAELEPE